MSGNGYRVRDLLMGEKPNDPPLLPGGSARAAYTLLTLAKFAGKTFMAWPSVETLAAMTGQSRATVTRHLTECEQAGLISPVGKRSRGRAPTVWRFDVAELERQRAAQSRHGDAVPACEPIQNDAVPACEPIQNDAVPACEPIQNDAVHEVNRVDLDAQPRHSAHATASQRRGNLTRNHNKEPQHSRELESERDRFTASFERVWNHYPNKKGKAEALRGYAKSVRAGELTEETARAAVMAYKVSRQATKEGGKYQLNGSTFFRDERWREYLGPEHGGSFLDEFEKLAAENAWMANTDDEL